MLSTSAEKGFWEAVDGWKARQSLVRVECEQQPHFQKAVLGKISSVNKSSVTLLEDGKEVSMDLREVTEFRPHVFDVSEAKSSFEAIWDEEIHHGVRVFTELLDYLN